eukprot:Gb_08746 [translate_table: standard]
MSTFKVGFLPHSGVSPRFMPLTRARKERGESTLQPYQLEIDTRKWKRELKIQAQGSSMEEFEDLMVEVKFEIQPFEGDVNAKRLDHWLEKLELSQEEPITKWEDFKRLVKEKIYLLVHEAKKIIRWQFYKQGEGQSVQDYTTELRKQAIVLGVSLKDPQVLMKYIGGLHSHIKRQVLLFKPTSIDQVSVQAQYIEKDGRKGQQSGSSKQNQRGSSKGKGSGKDKGKRITTTSLKCKDPKNHCNNDGHTKEKCWKLYPKNKKKDNSKKSMIASMDGKDIEGSSDVDEKVACPTIHKIVNITNKDSIDEEERTTLFCIKVQVKKTEAIFLRDSDRQPSQKTHQCK